ncbi:MAG: hypothetical protein H7A35_00065 [Planctomycetales bacterium]|nr:hypothetical protein [bacterium]UNM08460.1 MAG: hypothetical protein H7A35_00065 [Planctomycetales bacterium]
MDRKLGNTGAGLRGTISMLALAITLLLAFAFSAACGGRTQSPDNGQSAGQSLELVLAELEAMPVPADADPDSFEELRRELARVLREAWPQRSAARAPGRFAFPYAELNFEEQDSLAYLRWNCYFTADYDMNGEVGISDLTPLGTFLGRDDSLPGFPFWVDGDNNGIISLADITPIGTNFGCSVFNYSVQGTHTPGDADSWQTLDIISRSQREGASLKYQLPDPCGGMQYRIVPLAFDNEESVALYPGNGIIDIIEDVEVVQTGSITGTVVSGVDQSPLLATVTLEGQDPVQTGLDGRFSFSGLEPAARLAIQVSADGFRDNTAVYAVVAGTTREQRIEMLMRAPGQAVDAAAGGFVLGTAQSSLQIPAGSLVDSLGQPLSGNVNVQFSYLDPTDEAQMDAAPGDFCARQLDDSIAMLESFGMVEVFIDDGIGGQANLTPGSAAPVSFPIQPEQQADAPDTMPLYSFDEATGMWVEEAVLTKDPGGKSYSGELSHFSQWNADQPLITTCIEVLVLDNAQNEVEGALVEVVGVDYTGRSSSYTDADGIAHIPCRIDSTVQINASYGENIGGGEFQTPTTVMNCNDSEHGTSIGSITLDGTINYAPKAALSASAYGGAAPLSVQFDASGTTDRNDDIVLYEMDFDGLSGPLDWQVVSAESISHVYTTSGHFLPILRVTDSGGLESTVTILICVQ